MTLPLLDYLALFDGIMDSLQARKDRRPANRARSLKSAETRFNNTMDAARG